MSRFLVAAVLAFAAILAIAQPKAPAAAPVSNPPGTHTLNMKDADIQALIATVSEITGKNFIVGPTVQGKVTVISSRPMKASEIYDVFLSVLRVHGYAAIPSGDMIKIVPEAVAQQDGSGALNGTRPHEADEIVTQIVPVKHVAATDLVPILRPLMPQGAQLIAHPASNSLVISDRAGNVERMISIIHRIDTVSDSGVDVIPLQHASAAEVARILSQLSDTKGADSADQPHVFADERTNSILLSGGKSGRLRMRALIAHLDTPISDGGETQVVYLNYANAKDLVPILEGVAATLTGDAPPNGKAAAGAAAGGGGGSGAPTATIQAHEGDNALVISAPPAVFRSLQAVIRQLDIRRAQVLIEAVIAEVSDETANELGIQWQVPLGDKSHVLGGTNFTGNTPGNNIFSVDNALNASGGPAVTVGNGLNLGYLNSITFNGKKLLSLGGLLSALRSNGKNNILSTPSIMTLDNQEAMIKVAEEVPFVTGSYTTNTGTTSGATGTAATGIGNPFQTIQRKDVGLTLTVTPHINSGDTVRLDIHQEVSNLLPPVQGAVDLVTNKREIKTTVMVKDNSLLVLGGLISDNVKDSVQKVPALGDIPLIGNLFRYRSNDHTKQDLMVFLHPRILRDAATEAQVSGEKYNFLRTEQLQMRESNETITPRGQQPMLPEVHDFMKSPALDVAPKDKPEQKTP
ncbi:MAG: type II secretion system secretin GspD [Xanthomonadaceae bacterium]|nr:type II secretion system secretin GspD [Xanthomonadaceae bacterium]MDE1960520.1 type II secretion system secretin GspD [Xanthomonadaceae bacterium]